MKELIERIKNDGEVYSGGILKVDSFLNHHVDVELLDKIGEEFYRYFSEKGITKILTVEASGIAIAAISARLFKVPFLFAKKTSSLNLDRDIYAARVYSYTREQDYLIRISKRFLSKDDKVLILDDFLANGNALLGLISIVKEAEAEVSGIGIVVEKSFQNGGSIIRKMGYDLYSLARISSLDNEEIVFMS